MAAGDQPVKGVNGFYRFTHALAYQAPAALARSKRSRRGLRQLAGGRR